MKKRWIAPAILLALFFSGCAMCKPERAETIPHTTAAPTMPPATAAATEATEPLSRAELAVQTFAYENAMEADLYPQSLIELLERNPETEEFVLYYPLEYGKEQAVDLSAYGDCETVPLFMQWDRQWGYMDYGNDVAGLTACGPVCLSMVAYYLTGDSAMSPDNIIQFAIDNGYCAPGNGSYWSLIDMGGRQLGLDVTPVYIEEEVAVSNLEAGNPIICIMGPGNFTASGHFVVMTGMEDGSIRINDPNSIANSQRLWDFEEIADQIEGMWVMRYFG